MAPHPHDYWPSPAHEDLLRAALGTGPEAQAAWLRWRSGQAGGTADEASRRLLPLVHYNLSKAGGGAALHELRLDRIQTQIRNKAAFGVLDHSLQVLADAGVACLLLKGAALSLDVYQDMGLRPMSDLDVAVPHASAQRAVEAMSANGWVLVDPSPFVGPEAAGAATFQNPAGFEFDLHFSPFHGRLSWREVAPLWSAAKPVSVNGKAAFVLSAADQLLHTFSHGARFNALPGIRWVADAAFIIRLPGGMSWGAFVDRAETLKLCLVAWRMLRYLKRTYELEVPSPVLMGLRRRVTAFELLELAKRRSLAHRLGGGPHVARLGNLLLSRLGRLGAR
jgi:hypothetical protein